MSFVIRGRGAVQNETEIGQIFVKSIDGTPIFLKDVAKVGVEAKIPTGVFGKDEREWVDALCAIIADNAELLAKGQDSAFMNRVHLAMQAKGFLQPDEPADEPDDDLD